MGKDSGYISIGFGFPVPLTSSWLCVSTQRKTTEADRWPVQPVMSWSPCWGLVWMWNCLNDKTEIDQQPVACEPSWTLILPPRLQRHSWGSGLQRICFLTHQKLLRPYKKMKIRLLIVLIISLYSGLFLTWQSIFSNRADAGCHQQLFGPYLNGGW